MSGRFVYNARDQGEVHVFDEILFQFRRLRLVLRLVLEEETHHQMLDDVTSHLLSPTRVLRLLLG